MRAIFSTLSQLCFFVVVHTTCTDCSCGEVCDLPTELSDFEGEVGLLQYSTELLNDRSGTKTLEAVLDDDGAEAVPAELEVASPDEDAPRPFQASVTAHTGSLEQAEGSGEADIEEEQSVLMQRPALVESEAETAEVTDPKADLNISPVNVNYGEDDCKCIGLDRVPGDALLTINGSVYKYPSNTGSRCAAWHQGNHPSCQKDPMPKWCNEPFCYVDPCKCKATVPRVDPYMLKARWQNLHLFYSYGTCGGSDGSDGFTKMENLNACVNQRTQDTCSKLSQKCSWSLSDGCVGRALSGTQCKLLRQNDQLKWGKWECPCIGMSDRNGTYQSTALNVNYPGDAGSTCSAWHNGVHPSCKGSGDKPAWCSQKWCFVDPCTCTGVIPKVDNVFPGGDFTGRSVFYSFDTCGNSQGDTYTPEMNSNACSEQMNEAECLVQKDRCKWSFMGNQVGHVCRGIEVATNCVQTAFHNDGGASTETTKEGAAAAPSIPWAALVLSLAALLGGSPECA